MVSDSCCKDNEKNNRLEKKFQAESLNLLQPEVERRDTSGNEKQQYVAP